MVWIDSDILLIGFNKQWPLWREVSSIPSSSSLSSFGLHRPWGHRATVCRFESRSYKRQTLRHLRQTQREGDHFAMFTVQSVHKWQILTNSHLSTSVFKKTIHNVSLCVCVCQCSIMSCQLSNWLPTALLAPCVMHRKVSRQTWHGIAAPKVSHGYPWSAKEQTRDNVPDWFLDSQNDSHGHCEVTVSFRWRASEKNDSFLFAYVSVNKQFSASSFGFRSGGGRLFLLFNLPKVTFKVVTFCFHAQKLSKIRWRPRPPVPFFAEETRHPSRSRHWHLSRFCS